MEKSHTPASGTSEAAEAMMLSRYRQMPPWRKCELVDDANRTARWLALVGLRSRHPSEAVDKLQHRLRILVLGPELAMRVYGRQSSDPE